MVTTDESDTHFGVDTPGCSDDEAMDTVQVNLITCSNIIPVLGILHHD